MPSVSTLIAGRYQLTGELGRGGMGVVWSAFDELLHRPVAVKEVHFPPGLSAEESERLAGRTWREARAVAAIDTPAAVRVFDVVEHDSRPWIVMELVQGRTLSEVLRAHGALPQAEVARIGLALLDALDAAHAAGVLHRDVKPSNVLVGNDGRIALTDFGIATVDGDAGTGNTTSGVVLGSPSYVAPERLEGRQPTAAADLWSLGATLWTAAEGRPPYEGPTVFAVMNSVATADPPPCARCEGALGGLLRRLMDRDPDHRPPADEVREVLHRIAAEDTPPADPTAVLPTAELPVGFDRTTVLDASPQAAPPPRPQAAPAVATDLAGPPPARPALPHSDGAPRSTPWRLLVALLATAAVVTAVVLLLVQRDSSPPQKSKSGHSAGPSGAATGAPTGAPTGATLPAGWSRFRDPTLHWSIGVPAGWTRSVGASGTTFSDPAGGRYFLVASRYPAGASAIGAWRDSERSFRASHSDYARVRLTTIQVPGAKDAADWEFTYYEGGAALHALDHAIVVGSRGYAVYVQSHTDRWTASQSLFTNVIDSFRPGKTGA